MKVKIFLFVLFFSVHCLWAIDQEDETVSALSGITDPYAVLNQSDMDLPGLGVVFQDPVFGTNIRRITDASSGTHRRHEYSQLQAFNSDSTLILLNQNGNFVVRDVATLQVVFNSFGEINSPRWNPANPDEIIHFDSNDTGSGNVLVRIQKTNVRTGTVTDIAVLPAQYERVQPSISWEELSRNGRWITAYLYKTDDSMTFMAYDLVNHSIAAELDEIGDLYNGRCGSPNPAGPNWVAPSPDGKYMVIQWNEDGSSPCQGVEVYDIQTGAYVGHVANHRQHSDMGFDEDGKAIYVTSYFLNDLLLTVTRFPGSVNFANSYDKVVLDPFWDHVDHISAQGPPGVFVVTAGGSPGQAFAGEIYLVYTAGIAADNQQNDQAQVNRLTLHRSTSCDYYHEPHASMSRDGKYVVFASDWENCSNGVNDYLVILNSDDIPPSPPITDPGDGADPGSDTPTPPKLVDMQISVNDTSLEGISVVLTDKDGNIIQQAVIQNGSVAFQDVVRSSGHVQVEIMMEDPIMARFYFKKKKIRLVHTATAYRYFCMNDDLSLRLKKQLKSDGVVFKDYRPRYQHTCTISRDAQQIQIQVASS